jgi:hypothetical protein
MHACARCRGPLPLDWAANLHPDGSRTCAGTCRPLYLFESGNPDWVVAHDVADAVRVWCEYMGEKVEFYLSETDDWEQKPDDSTAQYWLDRETGALTDEDGVLTEMTALEVVNRWGRGFVASVDF